MKAGACELDITPAPGSEVPGQWPRRIATHVRDPLAVSALALESRGRRAALVSCDVLSLKNRIVADLRCRLSSVLDPRHLLVAATHTHTGPPVCDVLGSASDPAWIESLTRAIDEAVRTAFDRLRPARLGWATARAPGFAFPRRWRLADGSVKMHPRKDDPNLVEPEDQADDMLTVLRVEAADGAPVALCVNYACHANFFGGGALYGADYPGVVRKAAKSALGEEAAIVYLNGPCGDVGPDDVSNREESRYGEEPMERVGAQLAARAVELAAGAALSDDPALGAEREVITAAVRAVPEEDLRAAQEWAAGRPSGTLKAPFGVLKGSLDEIPQTQPEIIFRERLLVEAERREHPSVEIEIGALRIGDGALVALPGEIFTAIGREIRAASPFAHTALVELANGCYGYVPTAEAFPGGGYETWLVRSSRLAPATGAQMVLAGQRVLARLAS